MQLHIFIEIVYPAEITALFILPRSTTFCFLFLFLVAGLVMESVIEVAKNLQTTRLNLLHKTEPITKLDPIAEGVSSSENLQDDKSSHYHSQAFLSPRQFLPHIILSTFTPAACKVLKLYCCSLELFQLYFKDLCLLQHLQNPTCQQLPCSFCAVMCPHKCFLRVL